jgi:ATP-binding cassette subfamily B protein
MVSAPTSAPSKRIGDLALIFRFALRYPSRIVAAGVALLVSSGATLAIPSGFRAIIDKGFGSPGTDISRWFEYLLGIVVVMAVATAVRFYFVSWLGERVVADVRAAVQANLLRLAPAFFEENRPSEIASRLTADTSVIEQVVGTTVSVALRNIVLGTGGILYLFSLSPKLTGLLLLGIPVIVLPIVFIGRQLRKLSRASQDRVADVGAMVDEVLGAMKVVQAFGQEEREKERFTGAVETAFGTAKRRITMRAGLVAIVILLIFSSITLVMWQGALDVASGKMSGGTIAAFVLTGALVAGAFGALTEVYGDLLRGAGAAGRLAELIEESPGIAAPAKPVALPDPPVGRVAFANVTFRYPTRPEVKALSEFTLEVAPGETVAIVGPSGAGKTTLFQLLQRFYDPEVGAVSVDGVALPDTDPAWARARIAMVPQETVIFAASARDNLR